MKYKDTWAAKGSALYNALKDGQKKMAEMIYKQTTAGYASRYTKEDRDWFSNWRT